MPEETETKLEQQIRSQPEELEKFLTAGRTRLQVHGAAESLHRVRRIWLVGTGTSQHAAGSGRRDAPGRRSGRALRLLDAVRAQRADRRAARRRRRDLAHRRDGLRPGRPGPRLQRRPPDRDDHAGRPRHERLDRDRAEGDLRDVHRQLHGRARSRSACSRPRWARTRSRSTASARSPPRCAPRSTPRASTRSRSPERSLQIVGAGHASVTAREGALKVREGARVLAEGYDAEFFLHGTAVPLGRPGPRPRADDARRRRAGRGRGAPRPRPRGSA